MQTTDRRMIYLASSSPRRQELVRLLQIPVRICPSHVDETIALDSPPERIVEQLSMRKAVATKQQLIAESDDIPDGIVLGSDTIVVLGGQVLGKPQNADHAREMLAALQGQTHEVLTGIALVDIRSDHSLIQHRLTKVTMKRLTSHQIDRYIATGEPMDKAGSYGIQGMGATIIDSIDGCYFNVMGLSVSLLSDMLDEMGMDVW